MVKRREPRALSSIAKQQPSPEQVEAFAAAADGGSSLQSEPAPVLDPNAKRDYKAIRVPFNEYEFAQLEELAKRTGRTKLNAIRWAILRMNEEEKAEK